MMLGGSEDLAAILAVLDRLSNELQSNRQVLNSTCEKADEISNAAPYTSELTGEGSIQDIKELLLKEKRECEYLRGSLEASLKLLSEAANMMHTIQRSQVEQEIQAQRVAAEELLSWEIQVENAADEYQSLEAQNFNVNRQLVELYQLLQSKDI